MNQMRNLGSAIASGYGYVSNELWTFSSEAKTDIAKAFKDFKEDTSDIYTDLTSLSWASFAEPAVWADSSSQKQIETPVEDLKNIQAVREEERKKEAAAAAAAKATGEKEKLKLSVFSVETYPKSALASGSSESLSIATAKPSKSPQTPVKTSSSAPEIAAADNEEAASEAESKGKAEISTIESML